MTPDPNQRAKEIVEQATKPKIKRLLFWPHGAVMAFDEQGQQMPEIQVFGWIQKYFHYLEELGFNPCDIGSIQGVMNDGTWKRIVPILLEGGMYNYDIKPLDI